VDEMEENTNNPKYDFDFVILVALTIFLFILLHFKNVEAKDARTLHLGSDKVASIRVTPGRSTVLSFPSRPVKVILGSQGAFAVEYVESDIAIAALSARSHSNMFVYLDGRRFAFDLAAVSSGGDELVFVRDEIPKKSSQVHSYER
jgi:hypothetical protein